MKSVVRKLYTSPYDEELRELVTSARDCSERLYAMHARGTDIYTLLDNGLFNIHRSVSDCSPKGAKRAYEIYMDAAEAAHNEGDYNSALMMHTAMTRVTPRKRRKKDAHLDQFFSQMYGTEESGFAKHARDMQNGKMRPNDLPALQAFRDAPSNFIDAVGFVHYNAPISPVPLYNPRLMFGRRNTW